MRKPRVRFVSLIALTPMLACGGGGSGAVDAKIDSPVTIKDAPAIDAPKVIDAEAIDAAAYDFSCLGSANPMTTQATTVTVGGTAEALQAESIQAAAGIAVTLVENGSDVLQTVTSGSDGTFAFTAVPTNGSALDLEVKSTGSGERDDIVIPAAPLVADQPDIPVLELADSELSLLSIVSGGSADPSDGVFVFQVFDCANTAIGGATITLEESGSAVGSVIDVGQFSSSFAGTYIATNVPPGSATVTTVVQGHAFRTRTLPSIAETNTATQLKP